MVSIESAFELVNNLDRREAIRRFGPSWAIVVVNSKLEIETVQRFSQKPTIDEATDLMDHYPGRVYFYTHPGMYPSVDQLMQRVRECADSFNVL